MIEKEDLYRLEDIRDHIVSYLRDAKEIIDRTNLRDRAHAYVWGNMFAEEFGFLGKAGGDYLNEVIEDLREQVEERKEE